MKNFFKKLSFVLAIAMVLTSIAPATASAAAKNYVKVNGKKATATYAYMGGKEVTLTPYLNGKVASKVTIENSNPEKATIDSKGVVTPKANGNTIVTFKSGKTTIGKVTVKVRTRAKALNIYDRAEYKAGNKTKLTELTLKVGDTKDLQITMPLYKASKKAGAVKASYFTYAEVDGDAVEVVKNAGQRNFTVKAVKEGSAKVTIVANQKTQKNVRADKYYVEASFEVTVTDDKLEAKQSGAAKITVTGTDLTDKVADYTVKRGTVTLTIKEVKLAEDKKSAVLTSSSSNMPKGDYTLKFGELEAAFTVEDAKVTSIVIEPEKAIMTSSTTAVAYYKVFNQFDEDVTSLTLGANVDATGSDGAVIDRANKKVTFTNANGYTMNLSQVSLALVDRTNGVNVSKILTVSEGSKLNSVEFAGVYKYASGSYTKKDLSEGLTTGVNDYYLLFSAKDQYDRAYSVNDKKLNVNVLSTTGLQLKTAGSPAEPVVDTPTLADGVTYYAFQLDLNTAFEKLGAGEVTVMTVSLTNGAQTKDTVTVTPAKKIAKLTVANADVYGKTANELSFEAFDADGNAVTDYATLKVLNNAKYLQQFGSGDGKVEFVRKSDGSAKLVYHAASNPATISTPVVLTFLSETNVFSTTNLNVLPDPKATAIIGFDDEVVLGAMKDNGVSIKRGDFKFQDQYGNVMDDAAVGAQDLVFTLPTSYSTNFSGLAVVTNAAATDTEVVTSGVITATTTSSVTIKVAINGISGSDYTFKLYTVAINDLKDFEVGAIYDQKVQGTFFTCPEVYGYYNGVKVKLNAVSYDVHNGELPNTANSKKVTVPAIATTEGKVVKDGSFVVDIHNSVATQITKEYKYSSEDPKTNISLHSVLDAESYYYTKTVEVTGASTSGAINVSTLCDGVVVDYTTQFTTTVPSSSTRYYKVAGFEALVAAGKIAVASNGTTGATIDFKGNAGEYTLTVTFSTLDGATLTEDVTFVVK